MQVFSRDDAQGQFAQRLQHIRLDRRLGVRQLARMAGLSGTAIRLLEQGKRRPSMDTLLALAKCLRMTTDDLLGRV